MAFRVGQVVHTIGVVGWYDAAKGYGFIQSRDVPQDILLHQSVLPEGFAVSDKDVIECDVWMKKQDRWIVRVVELVNGKPPDWSNDPFQPSL